MDQMMVNWHRGENLEVYFPWTYGRTMNDLATLIQQSMKTKYDDVTTTNGYLWRSWKSMMMHGMRWKPRVLFWRSLKIYIKRQCIKILIIDYNSLKIFNKKQLRESCLYPLQRKVRIQWTCVPNLICKINIINNFRFSFKSKKNW